MSLPWEGGILLERMFWSNSRPWDEMARTARAAYGTQIIHPNQRQLLLSAKQTPGYCLVQVCLFLVTPENKVQEGSCRGRGATGERARSG